MNQTILLEHEPIDEAGKIRVRALPDAVIAPGTFTLEVPPGTDVVGG